MISGKNDFKLTTFYYFIFKVSLIVFSKIISAKENNNFIFFEGTSEAHVVNLIRKKSPGKSTEALTSFE